MGGYILTLATILFAWALFGASSVGFGLILRRAFRLGPPSPLELFVAFWTGWAALLGLLQLWHLALPISGLTQVAVVAIGLAGLALEARPLAALAGRALRRAPGPLILLLVATLWATNRSVGIVQFYDIGLYYLQAVAWLTRFAIVPGLINLQLQPGFPSSYFLYAALVNVGPFDGMALHIANGLLLLGLLAQGLLGAASLIAGTPLRRTAFWHTLTLAPALAYLFGQEGGGPPLPAEIYLNGFAADVGIFVLGLALSGLMAPLILEPGALTPAQRGYLRFAVALVACAGVAVKLSFAAYAAVALAVVYGAALALERPRGARGWAALAGPLVACLVGVSLVAAARSVIMSGYPFYPETFAPMPVRWRVPAAVAIDQANWVKSWARQMGPHWSEVFSSNAWFQPWLNALHPLITRPLGLALLAGIVGLATLAGRALAPRRLAQGALILLPPAASAVFWFLTAPGYRFIGAAFWSLALALVLLASESMLGRLREARPAAVYPLAALLVLLYTAPVRNPLLIARNAASPDGRFPIPEAALTQKQTASGLELNLPVGDDRCWAAPQPCAPFSYADLRLIRPGDLSSGFILDPPRSDVDLGAGAYPGVSLPPDLGILLLSGWHDYEPDPGQRWMAEEGVILLFSERSRPVTLTLVAGAVREGDGFGDAGRLIAEVAGQTYATDLAAGAPATLTLPLARGFTRVELRLEAGSLVPSATISGSSDTRPLSIAVRSLSFE